MQNSTQLPEPQRETGHPIPNLPLLRKVLDHIDAHPEEWNQGAWGDESAVSCGTAMCVAGWATELADGWTEHGNAYMGGRRLLGLTLKEADELFIFSIGNTREDTRENVQRVAESIAARAGERL